MKSPFTGKEMTLRKDERTLAFRKDEFTVVYHYYLCEDSGEQFTTTELDERNMLQVYNQYRVKHKLPFPEGIKSIREKYQMSASKMAEVLGFGPNTYRNYENGEVPSESNARLIQLAQDPGEFKKLLELSDAFDEKKKLDKLKLVNKIIEEQKRSSFAAGFENYLLGNALPDEYTGYKRPSLEKLTEMVVYFAEQLQPWKTKLNKLLFYADFLAFKQTGYSISGVRYAAINMGPVPDKYNSIFEYLYTNDYVDAHQTAFSGGGIGEQYKPNPKKTFDASLFNEQELEILEKVATRFKGASTNDVIEISHLEKAWAENFKNNKSLISYHYGFELHTI